MIANVRRARHNASASLNYGKTRARYRSWSRRSRRRRRWTGCRCRSRRRQRNVSSSLNSNKRRRAGLKIAYRRVRWVRRLIGIKPEVIQGAKANRVGILILGKRFRGPGDRARVLGNTPRRAAITLVIERAIICPAGLLNRRMKSDVRDVYSGSNRHAERLDSAIEVLIVESVFIVPDAGGRVRHFEAHEPDTIISRVRLLPVYRRTGPGHKCRLLSHGGSCAIKTKRLGNSSYGVRTVRSVVIHVALVRMTLAPGAFVRNNVIGFGKICRSRV